MTTHKITITVLADDPYILNGCYEKLEEYLTAFLHHNTFLSSTKIQPTYPLDDDPLTIEQINNIKSTSNATNIPDENFNQHMFEKH